MYENGRGFRTSIFFQKGNVDWFLQSFKEFIWEKSDGLWSRSRRSKWRLLPMTLGYYKRGKFLVFLEVKESSNGRMNCVIVPEGNKAEGWWQLMEVVHEVVGVQLIPPEWLKDKKPLKFKGFEANDPAVGNIGFGATGRVAGVFVCWGCNLEWELRTENKSPFTERMRRPDVSRVGLAARPGQTGTGRGNSNFKMGDVRCHVGASKWEGR